MAGCEVDLEMVYQDLLAEHKASQQQLHSKDEALKIFQKQLKDSNTHKQRLEQEIKQLHAQLARVTASPSSGSSFHTPPTSPNRPGNGTYDAERERYIADLEEAEERNSELCRQIQLLEDEKEELAGECDFYSGKCANLVKCLEEERQAKPPSHSALQTVMEENRQLRLEMVEVQAERDQSLSRIERYKRAVERRKAKEASSEKALQFAMGNKKQDSQMYLRRIGELESIANSLSESVKEKTTALSHQKRANKMLASRITELEHRLKVLEISGLWSSANEEHTVELADPLLTPLQLNQVSTDNSKSETTDYTTPAVNDTNPFSGLPDTPPEQDKQNEESSEDENESQDKTCLT